MTDSNAKYLHLAFFFSVPKLSLFSIWNSQAQYIAGHQYEFCNCYYRCRQIDSMHMDPLHMFLQLCFRVMDQHLNKCILWYWSQAVVFISPSLRVVLFDQSVAPLGENNGDNQLNVNWVELIGPCANFNYFLVLM